MKLEPRHATRVFEFAIAILVLIGMAGFAQNPAFNGFTPGNLVVSRSVYTGTASTIAVGQPLPPICPSTAACGRGIATDTGAYPSLSGTDNVFNNSRVDGSFGITAPIFLDQVKPDGTLVNTLAVPPNLVTTSFTSKTDLGLNLSSDGSAITFMAYEAPVNAIDVSNSNTPAAYDPTNPVGSSYYRAVVQVEANGAVQVTPTNAYSGNNGRAAILANGLYYMVGNANNGSSTPDNIVATTGVQLAMAGQPASAPATKIGNFSITQVTDPATGKPYPADKFGKDENFRGLTLFNNTLYVSKGSGSNGINTVYQVGKAGTLPAAVDAASTPITILPGFPISLAKNADAIHPFGIFFANATTMYLAEEGDGTVAGASTSRLAGLLKVTLVDGKWGMVYALQKGLNLGEPYSINGYPTSLNPSTAGLRNITGKVNADGTVTIYGVTATVSANGDPGADPNKLVAITDVLANTDPSVAVNESFVTLRTAAAGEVLRGVSFAPVAGTAVTQTVPLVLSSASYSASAIAPDSLATINGSGLATGTPGATSLPLPTTFGGSSVTITDSVGNAFSAPLLYVSPSQINFQIPREVAPGTSKITVTSADNTRSIASAQIDAVAPGMFTLNNTGLAAAVAIRVAADGTQAVEQLFTTDQAGGIVAAPIAGVGTDTVYLELFATGLRGADSKAMRVTIGGVSALVFYAGPQSDFPGLDQINVQIPARLAGAGVVLVQVTANGIAANPVTVTIQ